MYQEMRNRLIFKNYISLVLEIFCSFSQEMTGSICNERLLAKYKVSLKGFSLLYKLTTHDFVYSDLKTITLTRQASPRALKNKFVVSES